MKVFGWPAHLDGAAYYRISLPLFTLKQERGWDVTVSQKLPPDWDELDVVVGQRMGAGSPANAALWQSICRSGKVRTVYEIDDHFFSLTDGHDQATRDWYNPERLDRMRACARAADVVTVTTERLAETMCAINSNVEIIPNYVDETVLKIERPAGRPEADWPLIGWQGSSTHGPDFALCWPGVLRAMRALPDARFATMGVSYVPLAGLPRNVGSRLSFVDWIDITAHTERYYQAVSAFDIGLAPLVDNAFNARKSWIKTLEYAALGIPVVASAAGTYPQFVRPRETGFLVRREHEWAAAIRLLAHDPAMADEMGRAARELASQHTIQGNVDRWAAPLAALAR